MMAAEAYVESFNSRARVELFAREVFDSVVDSEGHLRRMTPSPTTSGRTVHCV
jgi:hypothetical protein